MKYIYLLSISFLMLFVGCKQRVYLTVSEPPIVHLGSEYTRAGFINRTFAGGKSKTLETIDKALSLEGNLDLNGSNAAIRGAYDRLTTNNRFEYLALMDSLTVENGGIGVFPAQLTWNEVEEQCRIGNVQFLMVLEVYDTDTKINYSTGMTTKQTPLGSVQVPVHNATMTTFIKTGWRIYDPNRKLIIDEIYLTDRLVSSGSGINPIAAAATLLNREQAVKQISTTIGQNYAHRIEPQLFRVWRNYYTKGSQNLKIAKRRSEVGDWDGAAEMWQKDLDSPKRKVAGRACYNMAIYKEISGDVDGALEMAQKAYSDYRIKEGQIYANILRDRIARREREKALNGQ